MEDGNVGKIWHKNQISDKSHKSAVAMVSAQFSRCVFPENVYSSKPAETNTNTSNKLNLLKTTTIALKLYFLHLKIASLANINTNWQKYKYKHYYIPGAQH